MHSLDSQTTCYIITCKKNLAFIRKEGKMFLNHTVTVDELLYHYHMPTSKQTSLTWKHKNSPHTMKTRSKTSAGKVMLTLFFDISGPVLVEWIPKCTTIDSARYVEILMKLHTIKSHWKGRLSAGIVLLHNNTPYDGTEAVNVTNFFEISRIFHFL